MTKGIALAILPKLINSCFIGRKKINKDVLFFITLFLLSLSILLFSILYSDLTGSSVRNESMDLSRKSIKACLVLLILPLPRLFYVLVLLCCSQNFENRDHGCITR